MVTTHLKSTSHGLIAGTAAPISTIDPEVRSGEIGSLAGRDALSVMRLTILMPCLNEAETLGACIDKAQAWIKRFGISGEVVVADNGSTDGSQALARERGARVVSVPIKGYGAALYQGVLAARGEYIIMGDSDDSYDFSRLDAFIQKLEDGFDLVMGNRFLGGIEPGAMPWKNRWIGNPILSWLGRVLFRCPAKDFHCGLRGFKRDSFIRMDLRSTGMEFASEMVIKANLFGMRIAEVATTLSKDGRSRPPHLRPWRDGWRHLRFMMLFKPLYLFVIPGAITFIISLFLYVLLLQGALQVGSITLDIHTLFYSQSMMILGFLAVAFGVVTRLFGVREGLFIENKRLKKLRTWPVLEFGCCLGLLLMFSGCYFGVDSLAAWGEVNFGALEYGSLLRQVSISTTMMLLGGISFILSLVMGFLAIPLRKNEMC